MAARRYIFSTVKKRAPQRAPVSDELRETPPNAPGLRFETIVGRGGMAVVWRAWHDGLQRNVAVKVLDPTFATSEPDLRQFMQEVRTMSALDHPGIVRGYGANCVDGRYYLLMDYVDGYTIGSLLARKGHLKQEDAVIIAESVAVALRYAWDTFHLVHCDLKPENLMVDADGSVKILDLGLCQTTAAIRAPEQSDEVIGTPAYISPEQIYGDVALDCRADIYCLGATLYHLVAGRTLFPSLSNDDTLRAHVDPEKQAPDPRRFATGLSDDFVRLLTGLLVKDPAGRYASWDDVCAAFDALDRGVAIPALPDEAISSLGIYT